MRKLLTVVAVFLVAGVLTWLVVFSQVFVVRHVEVTGTSLLTSDQVLAAADIPGTTQMVRLDSTGVIDRIVALPQVASVEVRRVPFDRVQIIVTERVAVAVIAGGAGFQLVDATGTPFIEATQRPPDLPLLLSLSDSVGDRTALAVAAALLPEVRAVTDSITATTRDNAELSMRSGAKVLWGSAADGALKSTVLVALLPTKAQTYDVSAPDVPTTTGTRA
jgi:cell division protein FtsQ